MRQPRAPLIVIFCFASWCLPNRIEADDTSSSELAVTQKTDILFAEFDDVPLRLDLHYPTGTVQPPLVMYIHGGAWQGGDRKHCKLAWLTSAGYAVASIEYRLSHEALFPAQIHDCKGALRWLRAHQSQYGYAADRVVVAGDSAGGYLAALMGTSANLETLEGTTAGHADQSSEVQGVIDYYGATDFLLRSQHQPAKTDEPTGAVYQLLGGPVRERQDLARLASPVTHVGPGDPPLLLIHGDQDDVVFLRQSQRLHAVYQQHKLDSTLHVATGKGHGWGPPADDERKQILAFLKRVL